MKRRYNTDCIALADRWSRLFSLVLPGVASAHIALCMDPEWWNILFGAIHYSIDLLMIVYVAGLATTRVSVCCTVLHMYE